MVVVATGESSYTDLAENFYNQFDELQGLPSEFSWDDKTAGGQLLLYQLTEKSKYKNNVQVEAILNEPQIVDMAIINTHNTAWLQDFLDNILHGDFTPKGLVWISSSEWGSCRFVFLNLQC